MKPNHLFLKKHTCHTCCSKLLLFIILMFRKMFSKTPAVRSFLLHCRCFPVDLAKFFSTSFLLKNSLAATSGLHEFHCYWKMLIHFLACSLPQIAMISEREREAVNRKCSIKKTVPKNFSKIQKKLKNSLCQILSFNKVTYFMSTTLSNWDSGTSLIQ